MRLITRKILDKNVTQSNLWPGKERSGGRLKTLVQEALRVGPGIKPEERTRDFSGK